MSNNEGWPIDGLEHIDRCPTCSSSNRTLAYSDVEDWAFRTAPGKWTLWVCESCETIYPDPRPNERTIGLAYSTYYTHERKSFPQRTKSILITLALDVYYRFCFDANSMGSRFLQSFKPDLDRRIRVRAAVRRRHLLPSKTGQDRLLDIGCGNGSFLGIAKNMSYRVIGIDPDPDAIANARQRGFDARVGSLPACRFENSSFDHITLSHVIEHLHDLDRSLCELWRLLRPGGRMWIETPNGNGAGLRQFGKYWRGLEQPRHLAILNPSSICKLLVKHGFSKITFYEIPACGEFFTRASLAIKAEHEPQTIDLWTQEAIRTAKILDEEAESDPTRADIMVVSAVKPALSMKS